MGRGSFEEKREASQVGLFNRNGAKEIQPAFLDFGSFS
jgi:hypothetical protein